VGETAIRVEGLGKRYRIGTHQPYYTLRESLTKGVTAPVRWLERIVQDGNRRSDATSSASQRSQSPEHFIWALRDVSFTIDRGQVVGVIGRNGAGKSTLLKILTRITLPSEGEAEVFGRVGSLLEVGTGFHPELTGRENIYVNGAILGMKRIEVDGKFDEIVAFAEVEEFIDTPVKHYSSGLYMRLAFAVAAHLDTEILLIDEVLAVGDIQFQEKCLGRIGNVVNEGRTVLFVSHNLAAISTLCETVICMDYGHLQKKGTAADVISFFGGGQVGNAYLSSAVVERNQQDLGAAIFFFTRAEMHGPNGQQTTVYQYSDKITLLLSLAGEPNMSRYGVSFYIYNERGQLVTVGSSGAYHNVYFDRVVRRIRIEIGPLLLTSGSYSISFVIYYGEGPTLVRVDTWNHGCFFTVHSRPFRPDRDISSRYEGTCILEQNFFPVG
jgi:lipopolysaccharide transport system ATP-binding protein